MDGWMDGWMDGLVIDATPLLSSHNHNHNQPQHHNHNHHTHTQQGVCAGLREVLEAATRHQLGEHLPNILPPIQQALCDTDPTVREAAGAAFGILFRGGAHSAVDGVVPSLLLGLDAEQHYAASIEGLRVILGVRPTTFNGVAPKLLKAPVTAAGLRALGELAGVAGACACVCVCVCVCVCACVCMCESPVAAVFLAVDDYLYCNNPRSCFIQLGADTLTEFSDALYC